MADSAPVHKNLITAVTTGSGSISPADTNNRREHAFYIIGSAGVAAGAVQIETAHDQAYAGTWAPLGSAVTVTASTQAIVQVTGALLAVRARVSTTITDGTVSVVYAGS
jgi:hypothetical protein